MSCVLVEMLIFNFPLTLQACRSHIDLLFQNYFCGFSPLFSVTNLSAFYRIVRTFLFLFPCLYNGHNTTLLFWCCCRRIWCLHVTVIDAL